MAIALSSYTDVINGTSINGSSGENRMLVFGGATDSGSDSITAVSWNSEAFTKLGSLQNSSGRFITLWYLRPSISATGSSNISITGLGAQAGIWVLTGVGAGFTPAFYQNTASSSSPTVAVTANSSDWALGMINTASSAATAGSNTTDRSGSASIRLSDSNGVASPTALNWTTVGSVNYVAVATVIKPGTAYTLTADVNNMTMAFNLRNVFLWWKNQVKNVSTWVNQTN